MFVYRYHLRKISMRYAVPRNLSLLTLRQIHPLSAIDEDGSLNRAAARLRMSQPRAMKSLRVIEELIGHRLFGRTNRGLSPTEGGVCAIRHARILIAQVSAFHEELGQLNGGAWVRMRIGTIMGAVLIVTAAV